MSATAIVILTKHCTVRLNRIPENVIKEEIPQDVTKNKENSDNYYQKKKNVYIDDIICPTNLENSNNQIKNKNSNIIDVFVNDPSEENQDDDEENQQIDVSSHNSVSITLYGRFNACALVQSILRLI